MKLALMHHRLEHMSEAEIRELFASEPDLTDDERTQLRVSADNIEAILMGRAAAYPAIQVVIDVVEVADLFEAVIAARWDRLTPIGKPGKMAPQLVSLVR